MSRNYAREEEGGWFSRIKERLGMAGEYEEDEEFDEPEIHEPVRRRGMFLRLHSPKASEISVRMNISSLNDAREAADRLKARQSIILNLEHTDNETAERVVDFVSGVTYALDGYYQKVGEKVFLFTPECTIITVEDGNSRGRRELQG